MSTFDQKAFDHERLFWQCDECSEKTNDKKCTDIELYYKFVGKWAIARKPINMTIRLGKQVYISPHTLVEAASRFLSVWDVCLFVEKTK